MSEIDILKDDWPSNINTTPVTITMDGSPIHSILDTINKQTETLKLIITKHNNIINDINNKTDNIINNNNKLDEKIINIENNKDNIINKLQLIIEKHEEQINELNNRPIYNYEKDNERISIIEKKLASFYGNDTNILGRVGHLEDGRLRDQENLANIFSQIKTLNETINHLKKDINQLKPSIKNEILNELNLSNNNNNNSNEDNNEDNLNQMKRQLSEIELNYIKKDEIYKLKDLINYVANDCHREINELKKTQLQQSQLINEQEEEIKHLKNQKDKFPSSPFSPSNTMNFSQNPNSHSLDELSNRLLTLEIRLNQLNHPSTTTAAAALTASASGLLNPPLSQTYADTINQMKQQIYENERNINRNSLRIDDLQQTSQISEETVNNLNQTQFKNHLSLNQEIHNINRNNNHILKQIEDLDNKFEKLESNFKDISQKIKLSSTIPSSTTGHLTPPLSSSSPIIQYNTPQSNFFPESIINFNKTQPIVESSLPTSNQINEQQLNDKFKIIVDELQKSLLQIRKDMNKKHKELENMIDKSLLHCESCEGILHHGTGNFTSNETNNKTTTPTNNPNNNNIETHNELLNNSNLNDTLDKTEKKDELNHTIRSKKDGDMDGTINLLTFRKCKRKCAVCQQREVNGILQKETLERINQLTEQINKINRKLEKHHEKHQNTSVKYDKVILGIEELKTNILQELQREVNRLNEQKVSKEDLLSSVLGIISQYNQEEITNQSQILGDQLTRLRSELTYLITTNNEVYQDEFNKYNKSLKVQSTSLSIHETELENLKRLIQKTQETFTTYITNPVSSSSGTSPVLLRGMSSENISDIRMEFNQIKQNVEKYLEKLASIEESNLQLDENNKKTRVFMDLVREEMKTIHKDNKQQLQSVKSYLDNDLNTKMINIINDTLEKNSHLLNKEIILVLKEENEKLKRNYKILEKRIYNITDSVNEKIGNENEKIRDSNERIIYKIQQVENELNKHLQNHLPTHNNSTHPLTSIYIPSFPSNTQNQQSLISPQTLSSPLNPPQSTSSPYFSPTGDKNNLDNLTKSSYPSQFRSTIKTTQSLNDSNLLSFSPLKHVSNSNSNSNDYNESTNPQNEELSTLEFQDYVHNILNPDSRDKILLPK